MVKTVFNSACNYSNIFCYVLGLGLFLALIQCSFCEQVSVSNEDTAVDELIALDKKAIDKMKFYGGLGKRDYETELESDEDESTELLAALLQKFKRLDKMKYYGGLGKRSYNDEAANSQKRLDKMRYYGGLGKRFHEANKKSATGIGGGSSAQISNAKKSKIDRLRYMGSLGK